MLESNKSFERKQELIQCALEEFAAKGYENASLNNIIKTANISKGTFYYHFKNKEELFAFLIGMLIEKKKRCLEENVSQEDLNRDFFSLLKTMTRVWLRFAKQNPLINRFAATFFKQRENEIYRKMVERFGFESIDYFNALVDRAYSKNEIRTDLPRVFVKGMVNFLFTNIQSIAEINGFDDYELAAGQLIEFLKDGLAGRS